MQKDFVISGINRFDMAFLLTLSKGKIEANKKSCSQIVKFRLLEDAISVYTEHSRNRVSK